MFSSLDILLCEAITEEVAHSEVNIKKGVNVQSVEVEELVG